MRISLFDWCQSHPEKMYLLTQWDTIKNGELTPNKVTHGSGRFVYWLCDKGHPWQAPVTNRTNTNAGCPYCSNQRVLPGYNDLATTHPDLAVEWHPTKNGNLRPDMVVSGYEKRVWWRCAKGHEWESAPKVRSGGCGCPVCANRVVLLGFNDLTTTNPDLAAEWHPIKNGDLTPEQVTSGSHKKVWWLDKNGHEWQASIVNRVKGYSCPANVSTVTSLLEYSLYYYLKKAFPKIQRCVKPTWFKDTRWELDFYIPELGLAVEHDGWPWHKNPDRDMRKDAICAANQMQLIRLRDSRCPVLHSSSISVPYRNGGGKWVTMNSAVQALFSYFGLDTTGIDTERDSKEILQLMEETEHKNSLEFLFPQLVAEWSDKNKGVTPGTIRPGSSKKIIWKCQAGHEWKESVSARTERGTNCPYCSNHRVAPGFNDLCTTHSELAKEWHSTKNGLLRPDQVLAGSSKKYWWLCDKGHSWQAAVSDRSRGGGCPVCNNKQVLPGFNDLATTCPDALKYWDYEKNIHVTPQEVTRGSEKMIWWKNSKGDSYQTPVFALVHRIEKHATL